MSTPSIPVVAERLRQWARRLKRELVTVYLLARDPQLPWALRLLALIVVGYALSPIDLIPDFIPILGYLDDVLLLPLGLYLVLRWAPPALVANCRARAENMGRLPGSRLAAAVIVLIWTALLLAAGYAFWPLPTTSSSATSAAGS